MMKQYVKENSSGEQMTLMGNVKCYFDMLDFVVCVCFLFGFLGIKDSKVLLKAGSWISMFLAYKEKGGGRREEMLSED